MKSNTSQTRIKLQLDYRTIVMVTKKSSISQWMKRYPKAVILSKAA